MYPDDVVVVDRPAMHVARILINRPQKRNAIDVRVRQAGPERLGQRAERGVHRHVQIVDRCAEREVADGAADEPQRAAEVLSSGDRGAEDAARISGQGGVEPRHRRARKQMSVC